MSWRDKLVGIALQIAEGVAKLPDGKVKESFRARCRSLISDLYTSGAAYVLVVAAARSSAEAAEKGLSAKTADEVVGIAGDKERYRELGLEGGEDVGYAVYCASLLYALKEAGVLHAARFADAVRELQGNVLADRVAFEFASWLKRFAEAYIHE